MKTKPLIPSLREKKRYLAFEVVSESILSKKSVMLSIKLKINQALGTFETAKAGIMFLPDKYNQQKQRGILKVNHDYLDKVKASLCLIKKIDNQKAIVRSLSASGMINKLEKEIKDI